MRKGLIKLPRNRVRRNYLGGAGIDRLHGEKVCQDNDRPEEWIGSMGGRESGDGAGGK